MSSQLQITAMMPAQSTARHQQIEAQLRMAGADADEIRYWWTVDGAFRRALVGHGVYPNSPTECKLAINLTQQMKGKDYRVIPLGSRHQKEYAHIAAYMTSRVVAKPTQGMQVSHLCHHGECVNPVHLALETREQNLDRNKCQGWTWIRCPHGELFNPCQHNPQCLLPRL